MGVYGAPWCPDCKRTKKFLGEQRVPCDWLDIDDAAEALRFVEQLKNGGRTIPAVIFLDTSNLLLPLVGFIPTADPRMRSTIEAIERELTSPQGFVYRYRGFDDGLTGGEGTFPIYTVWLADNLIALGEIDRARDQFEMLRGCANDLGLLSEEIDAETGNMLGNFPQAFSHLAHINAPVQLHEAEVHRRGSAQGGEMRERTS